MTDAALTPSPAQTPAAQEEFAIRVRDVVVGFGARDVLKGVTLDVRRGEVLGFVGGSGTGKSVLTRAILGLVPRRRGRIEVFGRDLDALDAPGRAAMERRFGVLFQHGALFSGLTVLQNVQLPMREHVDVSQALMNELAMLKLDLVGLPRDAADKYPSELSGGMIKRAALARALALDPEILFLDEPTSGLDPIGAAEFDQLIATLQKTLGLTVYMVTHDLDSIYAICDRIAALADGRIVAVGPLPICSPVRTHGCRPISMAHGRAGLQGARTAEAERAFGFAPAARYDVACAGFARAGLAALEQHGNESQLRIDRRLHPCGDRGGVHVRILVLARRAHGHAADSGPVHLFGLRPLARRGGFVQRRARGRGEGHRACAR